MKRQKTWKILREICLDNKQFVVKLLEVDIKSYPDNYTSHYISDTIHPRELGLYLNWSESRSMGLDWGSYNIGLGSDRARRDFGDMYEYILNHFKGEFPIAYQKLNSE